MLRVTVAPACSSHPQLGALHGKPEGHLLAVSLAGKCGQRQWAAGNLARQNRAAARRAAPTADGGGNGPDISIANAAAVVNGGAQAGQRICQGYRGRFHR
jgi:hypothetical protein